MVRFRIEGLPEEIAAEARTTGRSPGYGHPVRRERATGTGPCRSCLRPFRVGAEDRLLLTYRPASGGKSLGAPGPIFIHAEICERYAGTSLPPELADIPLLVEGRTDDGRTLLTSRAEGRSATRAVEECLAVDGIDFAFLRHGEAGCFIARVDRA
jgi:hypothetical protein